ncbi:hypothetical protein JL720_16009 [Aureococcus anophagefferens]|nr:hypothetical protein JL720_16009 [Aureococcus anophagefferens]
MAAPDAQQYVAQFEQCVAALQTGANAAQATKTLLALREDPRCLEIAHGPPRASRSTSPRLDPALSPVSAAALRAFAALWARGFADAARGPKEATRALARDVLAKGLRDAARQRVETQALFDVAKIAFGALRALPRRRRARRRGGGGARGAAPSAADLVSAVFGAAGGASQVAADVLGPLLEASARNCDWVASRCAERRAARDAAVDAATANQPRPRRRAAAAADDADAALDEGLAPLLEAWALVAGDEAVVLYDAAAAEGSNARPPWLHAVVAEVGASVFGRYARCRVEAARAQAAAGVLGELEEDASADDVAAGDARERLETAAAVGRRHVAASCRALDELLTTALERVGALGAATDGSRRDAEEVVVLADLAGALLADDDSSGETVAVPLAIAAAARRDGDAAGAAAALLHKARATLKRWAEPWRAAATLRADDGDGATPPLRCYAGLGGASAAQGFDGAGAARGGSGDAVAAMVDPLLRDLEAPRRRASALAAVGATLAAQLPYASPDARRASSPPRRGPWRSARRTASG